METTDTLTRRPSYLAQGYANVDVLPEQMMLQEMQDRRARTSISMRADREGQRREDEGLRNEADFEGYSSFVKGLNGMPEQDRVKRMSERLITNPRDAINPLIGKAMTSQLLGDRAVLDAKENTLRAKQADNDMRVANYEDGALEKKFELQDMEFGNAREKAKLTQKQIEQANYDFEKGDVSKVGESIFNMQLFGDSEEGRKNRDSTIKTIALLPKETEEDRNNIRAISDIAGGIAMGNQVKSLKSYTDLNNREFLRNAYKATGGMDLTNLPKDRAERDAFIQKAGDLLLKKGEDMQSFGAYISKVKEFNDTEESLNQLTADFTGSIAKLEELSKSDDPAAKKELAGEIALIRAKATGQSGHFQRQYANFENEQKLHEKADDRAKNDAENLRKLRSSNLAEQREGRYQYLADFKTKMALSNDKLSRAKWAQKIIEDGTQGDLGLPENATIEDVMKWADKQAPPVEPGASAADY